MRFLRALLELLFPSRATERLVREATADTLSARLSPITFLMDDLHASALLLYRDPVTHAAVVEAKFYRHTKAQEMLGALLADYLMEVIADDAHYSHTTAVLVPVPLSPKRRSGRGYNQVEEICRHALPCLGTSARLDASTLTRVRDTAPQTSLNGTERRENMKDAFAASRTLDPAYLYIVVDDVVTTGATLHAAVAALRAGGAKRILPIAIAH